VRENRVRTIEIAAIVAARRPPAGTASVRAPRADET
jgi:hypothetical protein